MQSHIEELTDTKEQPVYLPGDKICLRLRATHEVNLGSVWAVFRKLPERLETLGDPYITLPGKHYSLSVPGGIGKDE